LWLSSGVDWHGVDWDGVCCHRVDWRRKIWGDAHQ
jgi:hypothetical protein